MMVSIVIPTFNRSYVIREALASVFAQTYSDFEVLVVDDGSTDDTQQVVASFADSRVRYIRHAQNRGCGAAYNTGFREARGQLIAILDSDDLWKPNKLEIQVDFMRRNRDIIAGFTDAEKSHGTQSLDSFISQESPYFRQVLVPRPAPEGIILTARQMYLCLLVEKPVTIPTIMVRADALQNIEWFDESWPSGNDWRFFISLARAGSFGYIDQPLSIFRVQSDSTQRKHEARGHELLAGYWRQEQSRVQNDPEVLKSIRTGLASFFKRLGWYYEDSGMTSSAVRIFIEGFWQTRRPEFLLRAGHALMPPYIRQPLRGTAIRRGLIEDRSPQ